MAKCNYCKISIMDDTNVCPLCRSVLSDDPSEAIYPKNGYPSVEKKIKKAQRALGIYLVSAIVAEAILVMIHLFAFEMSHVVFLMAAFFIYGYITLFTSLRPRVGYQQKILLYTFGGSAVVIFIDIITGWGTWSVNYVLPSVFILMDLVILILMIANRRNWQGYIPMQLLIIALNVIPFVLLHMGLMHHVILPTISMFIAIILFVGTMIIGGAKARNELLRRFHA